MKLDRAVDVYLRHVSIERGLSEHTIAAYRRDLTAYLGWLGERGIADSAEVVPDTVSAFIAERAGARPAPA
ncbi:MAG: site-specific integrase, partial [Microbacterium sp.]|nr:site-specific integrase [Microbacterium sp.]